MFGLFERKCKTSHLNVGVIHDASRTLFNAGLIERYDRYFLEDAFCGFQEGMHKSKYRITLVRVKEILDSVKQDTNSLDILRNAYFRSYKGLVK